jgi:hypothetical protein
MNGVDIRTCIMKKRERKCVKIVVDGEYLKNVSLDKKIILKWTCMNVK